MFDPGTYEVMRPVAMFLSQFVKPPDDYVSVVAFDMRPTPLTDFTNDPARIRNVINLLLRNSPAFRETNLFDALKFVLVGGRGDSVVLEDSKEDEIGLCRIGERAGTAPRGDPGSFRHRYVQQDQLRRCAQGSAKFRHPRLHHRHRKSFLQEVWRLDWRARTACWAIPAG